MKEYRSLLFKNSKNLKCCPRAQTPKEKQSL
jgi:hypothetical protein